MRKKIFLFLALACLLRPASAQVERFMMSHQSHDTTDMVYGVNYMMYDPGGFAFYMNHSDSWMLLRNHRGSPIVIEGTYSIAPPDLLTLYDGADPSAPRQWSYDNEGTVADTCWSGTALIHFVSDSANQRPGYELKCYMLCESPTTMFDVEFDSIGARMARLHWSDSSDASSWIVRYGTDHADLVSQALTFEPQVDLTGLFPYTRYYYHITNSANDNNRHRGCTPKGEFRTNCGGGIIEQVHNVSDGPVHIEGVEEGCLRHVLTGYTDNPANRVYVSPGFKGSIALRNLEMHFSGSAHSPIHVAGLFNASNLDPVTKAYFILQGHNLISNNGGGNACIQVDLGTSVIFRAQNPNDHFSGTLCVSQGNSEGGAGIGARNNGFFANEVYDTCMVEIVDYQEGAQHLTREIPHFSAGGNIGMHSGIIYARGGWGAGIGGGNTRFWNGAILISGGLLQAYPLYGSAGVGQGSPTGAGLINKLPPFASALVLEDVKKTVLGAGNRGYPGGIGDTLYPMLAVAGSDAFFTGDSAHPPIYVYMVKEPRSDWDVDPVRDSVGGLDIYADISGNWRVQENLRLLGDTVALNVTRLYMGTTDSTGHVTLFAAIPECTRLYTEGLSPDGNPYMSVIPQIEAHRDSIPWSTTNHWHRFNPSRYDTVYMSRLTFTRPNTPDLRLFPGEADSFLVEHYTWEDSWREADELMVVNAHRIPPAPPFQLQVRLRQGSHFGPPEWLMPDRVTHRSDTLQDGDTVILRFPMLPGHRPGVHKEVVYLNAAGQMDTLRQIITQRVVNLDTFRACGGHIYLPSGRHVTEEGIYIDTFRVGDPGAELPRTYTCYGARFSSAGMVSQRRDSMAAYQIVFAPDIFDTVSATACDSMLWGRLWLTEEGAHNQVFRTQDGCDSTVTLYLTLRHSTQNDLYDTLCYLDFPYPFLDTTLLSGSPTGTYTLLDYNAQGCDSVIALHLEVQHPEPILFGEPQAFCHDKLWVVEALTNGDAVHWSSEPEDPTLVGQESSRVIRVSPTEPTLYTLHATLRGTCDTFASLPLEPVMADLEARFAALPDTATPAHTAIQLMDQSLGRVASRLWLADSSSFSDEPNPLYQYPVTRDSVLITLIVSEEAYGCTDTTSRTILYLRGGQLWMPNAFTPGRAPTEVFQAVGMNLHSFEMLIFDRVGRQLFRATSLDQPWDGTDYHGQPCPQGAYVYLVNYATVDRPNEVHTLKGTVMLIR